MGYLRCTAYTFLPACAVAGDTPVCRQAGRTILQGMGLIGSYLFRSCLSADRPFSGNPLMPGFSATRPFSLFACGLEIGRCHAGRGSWVRLIAESVIVLCLLGQAQDSLNRILSVHFQNGYSFIPGHEQETSGNFSEEDTGRVLSAVHDTDTYCPVLHSPGFSQYASNWLPDSRCLETVRHQQRFQPNTRDGHRRISSHLTNA